MTRVTLDYSRGSDRRMTWGRKDEEYMADFILISKRTLTTEEYQLLKYHFLLGADWRLCSRKLNMERGNFFHVTYRIQQKLGKVFRELEPYGLFPLDEYFATTVNGTEPIRMPPPRAINPPVQPPIQLAA